MRRLTIRLQARPGSRPYWQSNLTGPACLSRDVAMSPVRLVAIFSRSALCFLTGCGTLARTTPRPGTLSSVRAIKRHREKERALDEARDD